MGEKRITFSVFTKPWKKMAIGELGRMVHDLGFDGVELPVRPGFQVEPENVTKDLPRVARGLSGFGVKVTSVAGPADEATISACAEAGIPIIRICVGIQEEGYMATEAKLQKKLDVLVPTLDRYEGISSKNMTQSTSVPCGTPLTMP